MQTGLVGGCCRVHGGTAGRREGLRGAPKFQRNGALLFSQLTARVPESRAVLMVMCMCAAGRASEWRM